ncbi:MAG: sulfite exporter TauE/SafE family protein [Chloroflexota bacterium]|nr:sulfite exporter TauE/SafE family protein [Chloroflexota bacterium]
MAVWLLLLGFIAGIASGMFGIGGGVIIVPVLVALGFTLTQATGTSLAALLAPVGIFAVLAYYRAGKLNIATAAWIACGVIFGAVLGADLALSLPVETLQQLYGVFLLYAGWRFAEPRKWWAEWRGKTPPAPAAAEPTVPLQARWYWLLILGIVAGVASGMFGIGGGLIIVPALVSLMGFEQKAATGTSLAVLLLPVSLGAVWRYYEANLLDIGVAALVALGLIGGAFAGARIALSLPSVTIRRLYGLFLFAIAVRFIFFN